MKFFCYLLAYGAALSLGGQSLPVSNVYSFRLDAGPNGAPRLAEPRYLTAWNATGYNNQPSFLPSGEVLLTVGVAGEDQTDIHRIDLVARTRTRLTQTPHGEFSPRGRRGNAAFYAVRADAATPGLQQLWRFRRQPGSPGNVVLPSARRVGYYHWLDEDRVAYFEVAEPPVLVVHDLALGEAQRLTPNVGRCFEALPGGDLAYVHKVTPDRWEIKALDRNTLVSRTLAPALPGSEDFVVLPDGSLLMGRGSILSRYRAGEWHEVANLGKFGLRRITRLAYDGAGLLLVVNAE